MSEDRTGEPWVAGLTIGQVLARTAQRQPDHEAVIFPGLGLRWTYRQFQRQVDSLARGLLALGIRPGQHVALWSVNLPQWVVLQFATARIGAVLVNINPAYRPLELQYVLKQSDSVSLFLCERFKSSDYFAMLAEICPELAQAAPGGLDSEEFPRLRSVVSLTERPPPGGLTYDQVLQRGQQSEVALDALSAELFAGDPVNIQYTSGTTGFPKAATLSHQSLLLNAYYIGVNQRLSHVDRMCIPVPLYHCFGCVLGTLAAVVHGATMVFPAEYFQPAATLEALERERCTVLYGVPTMFIAVLQEPSRAGRDLSALRTGIMAGSPCPIEVMRQVIEQLGCREVTIAYGLTEFSPVITQTRTDDTLEQRVETVGRPLPGVEVRIVDPLTREDAALGTQGELCARGHGMMLGYYNDPAATAAAIDADGWLHTGDLALIRPDGCYKITGRIKDMVIRGGENIYPREIEEFLFRHPAVEQSAVVGVPDPKYGEELCAWVKLKDGHSVTEDELRDFCRQNLAHYKTPRYVRIVAQFPQTVTGKIQKFRIRELMQTELGLSAPPTA